MNRPIVALLATLWLSRAGADELRELNALLEGGQVDAAVQALESRLGENPFDPVQLNNLASAQARRGDVYTALDLLNRAARLAPDDPTVKANQEALRNWLAARVSGQRDMIAPIPRLPDNPPEPPPLWEPLKSTSP